MNETAPKQYILGGTVNSVLTIVLKDTNLLFFTSNVNEHTKSVTMYYNSI